MLEEVAEATAVDARRLAERWDRRPPRFADICPNPGFQLALLPSRFDHELFRPEGALLPGSRAHAAITRALAHGKRNALEIGGPTDWGFTPTDHLERCDNVVERRDDRRYNPEMAPPDAQGFCDGCGDDFPYVVRERTLGTTHLRDGANLTGFADHTYDLVISSHSLEHFPDPLRAALEWHRVLRAGGYLLLVLPWSPGTFDRFRSASNFLTLAQNFVQPTRARLLFSRFDEIHGATNWDAFFSKPSPRAPAQRKPPHWQNDVHWHVFDFTCAEQLLECLGMDLEAEALVAPYHMIFVARKPQ